MRGKYMDRPVDKMLKGMKKLSYRLNATVNKLNKVVLNSVQDMSPKQKLDVYMQLSQSYNTGITNTTQLRAYTNSAAKKSK